jgi:hypothetical protein
LRALRKGTGATTAGAGAIRALCSCSRASYPGDGTTVGGAARAGPTALSTAATITAAAAPAKIALMRGIIPSGSRPLARNALERKGELQSQRFKDRAAAARISW